MPLIMDVVQDKDALAFSTMQFVQPGFMLCSKHVIWLFCPLSISRLTSDHFIRMLQCMGCSCAARAFVMRTIIWLVFIV